MLFLQAFFISQQPCYTEVQISTILVSNYLYSPKQNPSYKGSGKICAGRSLQLRPRISL